MLFIVNRFLIRPWSRLCHKGNEKLLVQTIPGHSRISITLDVYSRVSLELEKQVTSKFNAVLAEGRWSLVIVKLSSTGLSRMKASKTIYLIRD